MLLEQGIRGRGGVVGLQVGGMLEGSEAGMSIACNCERAYVLPL